MKQFTGGKNPLKLSIAVVLALIVLSVLTLALSTQSQRPDRDFIEYWSAAKLLVQHADPYNPVALLHMEQSQGFPSSEVLVMPNPPCALWIIAPLGYLPFAQAAAVWTMFLLLAVLASIRVLQRFVPGKIPLVVFFLAAVIDCLLAGQCTIIVLLGLALFIRLEEDHPYLAGLSLTLTVLKPHLLTLFWLVLLFEIVRHRRFRILAGGVTGFVVSSLFPLFFNPRIWAEYRHDMSVGGLLLQQRPNLGTALRFLLPPHSLSIQFIPLAVGVPLGIWFWWSKREEWAWHREGALIVAGALLASPYYFHIDQVLFVPAVLYCYTRTSTILQGVYFVLNALAVFLILKFSMLTSMATVWTAPVFVAWFAYVYRQQRFGRNPMREPAGELATSRS